MLKYAFIFCFSISFAYSFAIEGIKITKKTSKEFINVNNTKDCGGEGTFLGLRVPDCVSSPCRLATNLIHEIETDFRLNAATPSITFTNNLLIGGVPIPIFEEIIHGPFDPTNAYTLEYTFMQSQAVLMEIRFTLHSASGALIICRELTLEMVILNCEDPLSNGITRRNRGITKENFLMPKMGTKFGTLNVEGVTNCGGNGNFSALFVPGCSMQPCELKANQYHTLSFLFNPSRTSQCVEFEQLVFILGQWISLYKTKTEENFVPGGLELLAYELFALELLDFEMTLRSIVKTDDGATELCLEFNVIFFA